MKTQVQHIHMVGIGGAGMSGIAEVLLNLGYTVSGSDLSDNDPVRRLQAMGAWIARGHAEGNLKEADVVVKSTAVGEDNPEVTAAKAKGIPVIPRAEMLAELMRLKTGIAVAGTHGKTTTTSLLGTVFKEAGLDPTVIIGGRLNRYGTHALMGQGEYLVAEADESDGSFLCLMPIISIVTNIDADHLDYYPDIGAIEDAFVRFLNYIPFYGLNVVCGDDPIVRRLLSRVKRRVLTYGLGSDNDIQAQILESGLHTRFLVSVHGETWGPITLAQPGRHNVQNALGVIGVSLEAGLSKEVIIKGLEAFDGVGRRLEYKGQRDGIQVVDDYGHHPTEIRATLETLRQMYPQSRLVVAFQPHRFSRTRALFGDFCRAFAQADLLVLTEIYAASEDPIPGVNGASLAQGVRQVSATEVMFCPDLPHCLEVLDDILQTGDILLTLGAGNIWTLGEQFLQGEKG
ncbi:UDP-N-acetylmuramate--L-alanine ligase [Desulfovermiculus halophilus]|uniref:UDP-N-acetylmuramate--L-alanine ligase n=1 Tax=Desulfovermiculus halophilus TaxID=339722 RepID=UPI00048577BA|nr:UDP-N-acetylmuramate--L-alanine ligase [Desulfovermiculus halophilus]